MSSPTNSELKQEKQHITKVLQSNGYSKQFIDKTRRQWHLKQQNKNNNQPAEKEPEPVRRINLPYILCLSEQLQRTLSHHNIKSAFCAAVTLRRILPGPKDPIPTEKKHNIIYKLDCKDCDAVCMGESRGRVGQGLGSMCRQSEGLAPCSVRRRVTAGGSAVTSTGRRMGS